MANLYRRRRGLRRRHRGQNYGQFNYTTSVIDVVETGDLTDMSFTDMVDVLSYTPVETGDLTDSATTYELVSGFAFTVTETGDLTDSVLASLIEYIFVDVAETVDGTDPVSAGAQVPYSTGMLVLVHIYFDEGMEGFSSLVVNSSAHNHEGRVLLFGSADREISAPVGPPRIGSLRVRLADTDQYFREKFGAKTPRGRKIEIKIGPEGGSETLFQIPAVGIIEDVTFPPGAVEIEAVDTRFKGLRVPIPPLITEENFPNLPQSSRGKFFQIVHGSKSSQGYGDQGAIELHHVDILDHRYSANRGTVDDITVYTKGPDEEEFTETSSGWSLTEETVDFVGYSGILTFVQFNQALPDGTLVRADIDGMNARPAWGHFAPIEDELIENPVDALIYQLSNVPNLNTEYDYASFATVRQSCNSFNYLCSWAITESLTHEAAITQLTESFGIDFFPSQTDKLKIKLTADIPLTRPTFTDSLHIENQSEVIQLASPTKNRFRYKFAELPAEGRYAEERVYDNLIDQETLENSTNDGIEVEDIELKAIADPEVAYNVIVERSTWLDQQSHRMRLRIGAPPNLTKIDLAEIIGITHYGGLQEGGWVDEPFKVIGSSLNLDRLEYSLSLIKRVQPPLPPEPQPLDVGQWRWNSRVGPWWIVSSRRLMTVMSDTRNSHRSLVLQGTPRFGEAILEVLDDGEFPTLANPIESFDCKRLGTFVYCVTQERTTGRVALHIVEVTTMTWVLLDEEVLASNSHGDCGVTISIRDDGNLYGDLCVVFQGDREAAGPATWLGMTIAPAGDYRRAYITRRNLGVWSTPAMLSTPDDLEGSPDGPFPGLDYNGAVHINTGRIEAYQVSGRVRHVYNVVEPSDVGATPDMYTQIFYQDDTLSPVYEFEYTGSAGYNTEFLVGDSDVFTYGGNEYAAFPIGRIYQPYIAIWQDSDTIGPPVKRIIANSATQIHADTFGARMPDINVRWIRDDDRLHVVFGSHVNPVNEEWAVYKTIEPLWEEAVPNPVSQPLVYQIGPRWPANQLARCGSEIINLGGQLYIFKVTSGHNGIPGTGYQTILETYRVDEDIPTASDYTLADWLADNT